MFEEKFGTVHKEWLLLPIGVEPVPFKFKSQLGDHESKRKQGRTGNR
jgi:hypothetical protein